MIKKLTPEYASINLKVFLIGLYALTLVSCGRKELSGAPERGTITISPSTQESVIAAKLSILFSELAAHANKEAPTQFSKSGREKPCKRVGPKGDLPFGGSYDLTTEVCADVDYRINVSRDGAISVKKGPLNNSIRAIVPIKFDGQAGFTGFIAEATGLNRKNFDGAISAIADLSIDIGPDWCPKISVSTDFDWRNKARIEVVGGVWIPIADQVSGSLRDALNKLADSLKAAINCDRVRADVSKVWAPRSFPVSIPSAGTAYVNAEPIGLGFSGLSVVDDRVQFAVQMKAKVELATSPATGTPKSLPPLERVPMTPGRIILFVPLRATYDPLLSAVSAVTKDKEFSADTQSGKVSVTVNEVTLYPSRENLVVGISFKADLPRKLLDTSGQVYLYGRPSVDGDGQIIAVKNVQFARILDNDLWNILSAVFENRIKTEITRVATLDLSPTIAQAKSAITLELGKVQTQSGIRVELNDQKMTVRQIVPADKELLVEVSYEATGAATLAGKP